MGASSLNKVILEGYFGNKPDFKVLEGGVAVATVSLATNARWKNKDGEQKERTDWHRIVFYRGLAEVVNKHLNKGSHVIIEGALRSRTYTKNDETIYITEVEASDVKFLDKKETAAPAAAPAASSGPAIDEKDIPFD